MKSPLLSRDMLLKVGGILAILVVISIVLIVASDMVIGFGNWSFLIGIIVFLFAIVVVSYLIGVLEDSVTEYHRR